MFEDYNKNYSTQGLFSEAVKSFRDQPCYGFENNGTILLTSDPYLLELLALIEQATSNSEHKNSGESKQLKFLDFGGFGINPNHKISAFYNNCLFVLQGEYHDDIEYGPGTVGGGRTIILSDSMNKIKKFIKPIYDKHIEDFHIDFNKQTACANPVVPLLSFQVCVNNKMLKGLKNNGCYCSKDLLKSANEDLNQAIDRELQNQAEGRVLE